MPAEWQLIVGTEAGSTAATIDLIKRVAAGGADAVEPPKEGMGLAIDT